MVEDVIPLQPNDSVPPDSWLRELRGKDVIVLLSVTGSQYAPREHCVHGKFIRVDNEFAYRFYLVLQDSDGNYSYTNVDHIISIGEDKNE